MTKNCSPLSISFKKPIIDEPISQLTGAKDTHALRLQGRSIRLGALRFVKSFNSDEIKLRKTPKGTSALREVLIVLPWAQIKRQLAVRNLTGMAQESQGSLHLQLYALAPTQDTGSEWSCSVAKNSHPLLLKLVRVIFWLIFTLTDTMSPALFSQVYTLCSAASKISVLKIRGLVLLRKTVGLEKHYLFSFNSPSILIKIWVLPSAGTSPTNICCWGKSLLSRHGEVLAPALDGSDGNMRPGKGPPSADFLAACSVARFNSITACK